MIDLFNIPSNTQSTFTFYATGNWQTWTKPRNAKLIQIFCLGGGGGGGHPIIGPAGTTGGGGGGASGIVRGIIPAFLIPDTLYILVGKGGIGPTSASSGGSGGISYVGLQPSLSEQTLICKSLSSPATGGGNSGAAGGAGVVTNTTLSAFGNLGLFIAISGLVGSTGGTNTGTSGNSQTSLSLSLVTGGAGGGGKTSSVFGVGGNISSSPSILTSQVNGGVTSGQNGDSGYGTLQPFCGTGGAGGASVIGAGGAGGKGGNGWYGCGGGGAGASSANTKAGDGGDGLVIITVIS